MSFCHQIVIKHWVSKNGMMHPSMVWAVWAVWALGGGDESWQGPQRSRWFGYEGSVAPVFDVIWLSHGKLSQLDTLITTCTSSRNGEAEELQLVSVQYITKVYPVRCPQAGILVIMPCALSMRHIVLPKKSLSEQWWRKQNAPTGFKPAPFASAAWFLFCSHTFALGVLPWAAFYVFACVAFGSRRRATAGEIVSAPSNFWSIFWSSTGPRPQRVGNVSVTCRSQLFSASISPLRPWRVVNLLVVLKRSNLRRKMTKLAGWYVVWHGMTMYDRTHWIKQMVSVFLVAVHVLPLGSWCQWCPIDYVLLEA